jgi:hypothetical protein
MDPKIFSDKLESKINPWVMFLIVGLVISFQTFLYFFANEEVSNQIISVVSIINPLAATFACFVVARRYLSSHTFGKAYLLLSCGYLSVTIAEILYLVYDIILQIDPYPSIADVFFFALYPFVLAHLIIITHFFKPKVYLREFLWMVLIPISIVSSYITLSFEQLQEANFDFYYGLIFAVEPAVILPFAILGAKIFRGGVLGTPWFVLVIAIISLTIGDVWYYYLEIFEEFSLLHPVNMFWYAGYWIVVYSLYKHKKSI